MNKNDKEIGIVLGIVGVIILALTEYMLILNQTFIAMGGIAVFVGICFGMVILTGKKDDQTANLERMGDRINEQSRTIMSLEAQIAKYKRIVGELTDVNEAATSAKPAEPAKPVIEEPVRPMLEEPVVEEPAKPVIEEPITSITEEPVVEEPEIPAEPVVDDKKDDLTEDVKEETKDEIADEITEDTTENDKEETIEEITEEITEEIKDGIKEELPAKEPEVQDVVIEIEDDDDLVLTIK